MADLVTRILLNDKQFSDTLARSKKQVSDFDKIGKVVSGTVMKFAGAFGIAASATEGFKKLISSTQSNTDSFNSAIEQAKAGVDFFFDSIATGSFENFFKGFDGAIERARKLYDVMDTLGDMQAGWSDIEGDLKTQINENLAKLYDVNTPLEERKKLLAESKDLANQLREASIGIRSQIIEGVVATAAKEAQLDSVTTEEVDRYLRQISMHQDAQFEAYMKKRKELEKASKETTAQAMPSSAGVAWVTVPTEAANAAKKQLDFLKSSNTELERMYYLSELISDEERTGIVGLRAQERNIRTSISALDRQLATTERRYGKARGTEAGGGTTEILPIGSLSELDKQITEARKLFLNATTDEARAAADQLIKDLESRKAFIEIEFKYTGIENIGNVSTLATANPIGPLEKAKGADVIQPQKGLDSYVNSLSDIDNKNRDIIESVYGISDALSGMSNLLGESGDSWMQWGANLLTVIGRSLPAIMTLTSANTAAAAAGGAASVAAIPVVGPILAVAAIASILGALASVPKFESGGIVPGGSYSGDNVLARVNSGELILNTAQQRNLAGALDAGLGGNVKFKIDGSSLVGILEQESRKQKRI